jgi:tripartite ATP-independent transporter DctM subunit
VIGFVAILLFLLAGVGVPLFALFAIATALGYWKIAEVPVSAMISEMHKLADAPALTALPLFTFSGFLLAESKAPQRLLRFSRALFGWLPGGVAVVSLFACAIFTAFTGASGVTIIALGGLLLPALLKDQYSRPFSLGLLTTSGSLGLLFPPSLPVILYSLIASVHVKELFLSALLPGVLLILVVGSYCVFSRWDAPRYPFSGKELLSALKEIAFELPLPILMIVGIYGGYFTAGEAAAVMGVYLLLVEVFIYRDIPIKDLPRVSAEAMAMLGAVLLILGTALGFTNFLIDRELPMKILQWIQNFIHSKITFLIVLNIFLLIVGCLMDIFSAIVVVVPLIIPISQAYGVDPYHLGVIFLTNLEIGYFTPPVGINLFLSSFRFGEKITYLYRATLPFFFLYLLSLLIITYVGKLSLWWR